MSDSAALRFLKYGVHASTTDWSAFPGTTIFLEPENDWIGDVKPRHVDRASVQRGNGQRVLRKTVGKMTEGLPDLELALRALSGSGAGNGVSTSTLTHDLDGILTAGFGLETEGVGDTLSGTPGPSTTIAADGAVSMNIGQGVVMTGDTSGKLVARQVTGTSGSTFDIDRDLTDDTGAADNPTASSVVYGMRCYSLNVTSKDRVHYAFDAEGDNYRNKFVGCLANLILRFPPGEYARAVLNRIRFTDHSDDAEETVANPTWATPTRGKLIQCIDAPMHIGADPFIALGGLEIDLGLTIVERGQNGPNGPHGFAVIGANPTFKFSAVAGTLTSPKEITDALLATYRADTAFDCAWQFGRELGGICYVRAPALELTAERGTLDGMDVINFTARTTDASEIANNTLDHQLHVMFG